MSVRNLFDETQKIGLKIKSCCEVGVYYADNCSLNKFIDANIPTTLVEADPLCIQDIERIYGSKESVQIVPNAIWDEYTNLKFYRANASTFAGAVQGSPAEINDLYELNDKDSFSVRTLLFNDIAGDSLAGGFDLVLIDVEGAEYNVLKYMKSRPKVLSLEMRASMYLNPRAEEIKAWLNKNNYSVWFHNDTDTVYVHGTLNLNFSNKTRYFLINLTTNLSQFFKRMKKNLRRKKTAKN